MCFGYAYVVKDKLGGYSFLAELADCAVEQVSIEAAQPRLDVSVLAALPSKHDHGRCARSRHPRGRDRRMSWPAASAPRCNTSRPSG